jgi:hypothetical protein
LWSKIVAQVFHEKQAFPLRRVGIVLLIPPGMISLLCLWQVVFGHHWNAQSLSKGDLIFWTIFLWLVYLRLITVRLITEVRDARLIVSLRGIRRNRRIPLSDIRFAEVIEFDALRDYRGYGIRSGRAGKAWIANGNRGVRLRLANNETLVVGSQRPEELAIVLRVNTAGRNVRNFTEK